MPLMEVLPLVGNPNKDYFTQKYHYCNYLDLGLDFVFSLESNSQPLERVILKANQCDSDDFTVYDRCNFEVKVDDCVITP